jgi:hypothetical protein
MIDPCPVCGCQRYDGTCYNHECSETDHRPRRLTSDVPPRGGYAVPASAEMYLLAMARADKIRRFGGDS